MDILIWKNKVKSGGFLMGHDSGVVMGELNYLKFEIDYVFEDSSWVVKIP